LKYWNVLNQNVQEIREHELLLLEDELSDLLPDLLAKERLEYLRNLRVKSRSCHSDLRSQASEPVSGKKLTLENLVGVVPSFSDEFLLCLAKNLYVLTGRDNAASVHPSLLQLFEIVCWNPYNAFKVIDLIYFLLLSNL